MTSVTVRMCIIEGCGRLHEARGYCRTHYGRFRLGQDVEGPMRRRNDDSAAECSIEGCAGLSLCRGYCKSHYNRDYRGVIDINVPIHRAPTNVICAYTWCESKSRVGGFCPTHYKQKLEFGEPRQPTNRYSALTVCSITECDKVQYRKSMCRVHDNKAKRFKYSAMQMDMILRTRNCPICDCVFEYGDIVIDHDHSCCPGEGSCGNCIRGPLCSRCNVGLGMFRDSAESVGSAFDYLMKFAA